MTLFRSADGGKSWAVIARLASPADATPSYPRGGYSCVEVVGEEVLVLWETAPELGDESCSGTCRLVLSRRPR